MRITSSLERLAASIGVESGSRQIGRTTLLRLVLYYAVVVPLIAGFILFTEAWRPMVGRDPAMDFSGFWAPLLGELPPLAFGAASVTGAFLLAMPVAFVYVRTRNRLKYDQSLVQTVIMLPVVVTAILIVVQNSLALAFSLAGIVAAVRFRNNLKDSRDAVYIFAAVGIGFAAGVGHLAIAVFLSLFFCVLELLLWKLDLTADHERTFGMLCMPAPAPGTEVRLSAGYPRPSLGVGRPSLAAPAAAPAEPAVPPPPANGGKKAAERVRLYVTDAEAARPLAEAVFGSMTKKYKLRKTKAEAGQAVLDYELRTRKKAGTEAVLERIYQECVPFIIAAEALGPKGRKDEEDRDDDD